MKTVFAVLNAKYSHTGLGARTVAAYIHATTALQIGLWERTINHRHRFLLRDLAAQQPDIVVFSCYIWNIEMICRLAEDFHKCAPHTILVAAGPEVSYDPEIFLAEHPDFHYVIAGEGEQATAWLLQSLRQNTPPDSRIIWGKPLEMDALPFAYGDLNALSGRIMYYESMRGCPFRCAYCLSSAETGGVRFRSLPQVFSDLSRFIDTNVHIVKFVDRTFNCNPARAIAIWQWLSEHDHGSTCFHFEIAGELLDAQACAMLSALRPGLVQLEIGVQSTNPETLRAIDRPADLAALFASITRVQQPHNVHLHLDLIAGLPFESYAQFACSFNDVYALQPDQLQLGFLKILKGSPLKKKTEPFGLVYQAQAPYEILSTDWLSFCEISRLQQIADMVELYYNSGRFQRLLAAVVPLFSDAFTFFEQLSLFYTDGGYDQAPPSKLGYYTLLGNFLRTAASIPLSSDLQWLCRYDMAAHEKPKKQPDWVSVEGSSGYRDSILTLLGNPQFITDYLPHYAGREPKQLIRMVHVEVFPFDPISGCREESAFVFDYHQRSMTEQASIQKIDSSHFVFHNA